jgi:hypothetical protein
VLGVVPVVELVLGGLRHVHRRDQRALRHGQTSCVQRRRVASGSTSACCSLWITPCVAQAGDEHVEAESGEAVGVDPVVGGHTVRVVGHQDPGPRT